MTRYTELELNQFNRYTNLLRDLVVKEQGEFDGICMNAAKCSGCARDTPAGIPRQLRDSDRVKCPACVKARGLAEALARELHGAAGAKAIGKGDTQALTDEVKTAMAKAREQRATVNQAPNVAARLTRLANGIQNLQESLARDTHITPDERYARERIIAAAVAGYRKQSGGLEPPPRAKEQA